MAYKDPYVSFREEQIRKIYAQPTREKQIEMQYDVFEEMMFLKDGLSTGKFTPDDVPIVVFSEEEKKRLKEAEDKGVTLDDMIAYLDALRESEKSDHFVTKI